MLLKTLACVSQKEPSYGILMCLVDMRNLKDTENKKVKFSNRLHHLKINNDHKQEKVN